MSRFTIPPPAPSDMIAINFSCLRHRVPEKYHDIYLDQILEQLNSENTYSNLPPPTSDSKTDIDISGEIDQDGINKARSIELNYGELLNSQAALKAAEYLQNLEASCEAESVTKEKSIASSTDHSTPKHSPANSSEILSRNASSKMLLKGGKMPKPLEHGSLSPLVLSHQSFRNSADDLDFDDSVNNNCQLSDLPNHPALPDQEQSLEATGPISEGQTEGSNSEPCSVKYETVLTDSIEETEQKSLTECFVPALSAAGSVDISSDPISSQNDELGSGTRDAIDPHRSYNPASSRTSNKLVQFVLRSTDTKDLHQMPNTNPGENKSFTPSLEPRDKLEEPPRIVVASEKIRSPSPQSISKTRICLPPIPDSPYLCAQTQTWDEDCNEEKEFDTKSTGIDAICNASMGMHYDKQSGRTSSKGKDVRKPIVKPSMKPYYKRYSTKDIRKEISQWFGSGINSCQGNLVKKYTSADLNLELSDIQKKTGSFGNQYLTPVPDAKLIPSPLDVQNRLEACSAMGYRYSSLARDASWRNSSTFQLGACSLDNSITREYQNIQPVLEHEYHPQYSDNDQLQFTEGTSEYYWRETQNRYAKRKAVKSTSNGGLNR